MTTAAQPRVTAGGRTAVELHGVEVWVPRLYTRYNAAQRERIAEIVGSLVRSGADHVEIYRLTRVAGDGNRPEDWKAAYSYSLPPRNGRRDRRLVGHPRA